MASSTFQPLQGMADIVDPEVGRWQRLEETARRVLALYAFSEIRPPILERAELFIRGIGDTTDVVQKEMYRFVDRGGREIALRPEGTAGVMRYIASGGPELQDSRLYYIGPMFRCERPQAGRRRQFHQLGAEALGEASPAADAECIALQLQILAAWGLSGFAVQLNTRGLPEDREQVAGGLRDALRPLRDDLCPDCRRRFETNILRILDCKVPACRQLLGGLPPLTAFMSNAARAHLDEVRRLLRMLDIAADLNPRLVRGLDYYVHTVWEITHRALGAQDALCGGGRYRFELGKRVIEGVGFAMGLERVLAALAAGGEPAADPTPRAAVWIVTQHPDAFSDNLILAQALRLRGVSCGMDLRPGRSLKAQMRAANKAGAPWVVIRGEQELRDGTFLLKDMSDGSQAALAMPELLERLLAAAAR